MRTLFLTSLKWAWIAAAFYASSLFAGSSGAPTIATRPTQIGTVGSQNAIGVLPSTSVPGVQRFIVTQGCVGLGIIDESQLASGRLIVRAPSGLSFCGAGPQRLPYTPREIGNLQVLLLDHEGIYLGETRLDTLTSSRSLFNLNGMWFDPETNGSGISFHHSASSDGVFGTWFLFATGGGGPRWLSLQSMRWMNGGVTATGLALDAQGSGASCAAGDDCPRAVGTAVVSGSISLEVLDANNIFIQGHDSLGRLTFTSYLRKLKF